MFEPPDAKRVRREDAFDVYNEADEDISLAVVVDDTTRAKLNERLSSLLSLNINLPEDTPMTDAAAEQDKPEEKEEEEFAFRLFSTSTSQAVVLVKKTESDGYTEPGQEVPFRPRPLSHYIRPALTPSQKAAFDFAAVSAQDVKKQASARAWGLEVPWRVTKITVMSSSRQPRTGDQATTTTTTTAEGGEESAKKKTRPGKKKRIVLRAAEKKRKEEEEKKRLKKEKQKNLSADKGEALKAKKARLNRERKLKRRQKAREEKAARAAAGGAVSESGSGSGSDSD